MAGWGNDDEVVGGGGWGADDEAVDEAQRELPAGVKPNETAGAGRGGPGGRLITDQRRGGTRSESRPYVASGAPAVDTGPMSDAALQQAGRQAADPMLRPEFIDQVRGEFEAIAPAKRLPMLRELASGTDVRARAARSILRDVEAENASARDAAADRPALAGILAKAGGPVVGGSGGAALRPAPVAMPEAGRFEQTMAGETDEAFLQRDAGGRAVARDQQSPEAFASRAMLAERDFDAERFAAENPTMGALASGGARQMRGALNLVPTVMDFAARMVGIDTDGINGESETSAQLKRLADSYMPKVGRQDMAAAWERDEFGGWLLTNLVAQTPQIAQSVIAAFVPGMQGAALGAMGATAAGNKFADTGSSLSGVLSGAVEVGSEMLPLAALKRSFDALKLVPAANRGDVLAAVGRALPQVGKAVTVQAVVGAIEESAAQVGNNVIDIANGEKKSLLDGVVDAAVLGAAASGAMSGPKAAGVLSQAAASPERQFAKAFEADTSGTYFRQDAIDGFARRAATDPNFTDPTFIDPQSTVKTVTPLRAEDMKTTPVTPDEVVALARASQQQQAAQEAAVAVAEQSAAAPEESAAAPASSPDRVGIKAVAQGTLAAAAEGRLKANAQQESQDQDVEGNNTAAPAPAVPARAAAVDGPAVGAAAPAASPAAADAATPETAPAAQPAAAPTAADSPQVWQQHRVAQAKSAAATLRQEATKARKKAAEFTAAGLTAYASQEEKKAQRAEARAQEAEANQRAFERIKFPGNTPAARSFNAIADAMEQQFGRRPIAYIDDDKDASDGFADGDKFFVNLSNPERGVAFTAFHELQHVIRNEARRGGDKAKLATQMLDQVWGMIPQSAKETYVSRYLMRDAVKAGTITTQQALDPGFDGGRLHDGVRDEMLSDFMGKRAEDEGFWRDLAKKQPKTFGTFVQRWSEALSGLIAKLRGLISEGGTKDIDAALKAVGRLERAKAVAERVVRDWSAMNPKLAQQQGVETVQQSQRGDQETRTRGVAVEAAPNPDQPIAQRWRGMDAQGKEFVTKDVMDAMFPALLREMGWPKATYRFGSGMYEGEINLSVTVDMPQASPAQLDEMARVLGYLLDQKAMVTFDESDVTSEPQFGFVKVVLPGGMSTAQVDSLRQHIASEVPQASGDSVRDGAIVYGNFSGYSDSPLSDDEFYQAIVAARDSAPAEFDGTDVVDFGRFTSNYIEPANRDAYLEGTRYGQWNQPQEAAGRDAVRGRQGDDPGLARLKQLAERTLKRRDDRIGYVESGAGARREAAPAGVLGAGAAAAGSAPRLSYGRATPGAVAVDAWHFSQQTRPVLSSAAFGTGLIGSARDAFMAAQDKRLAQRIHFYVNRGEGIHPEAGVGGMLHRVKLNNLYDADTDPKGFRSGGPMSQQAQSRILDAGYDGFFVRGANRSGMAVLLGQHAVQVEPLGLQGGAFDGGEVAPTFNGPIWYSRRGDNELGAFNSFEDLTSVEDDKDEAASETAGDSLSQEEMDALGQELAEAQGLSSVAPTPANMSFSEPSDAALASVGLMAEDAYRELPYEDDGGGTLGASVKIKGNTRTYNFMLWESSRTSTWNAEPAWLSDLGTGAAYGIDKATERFARGWNRRVAASMDLQRRGFDLFTSVPAAARKRVIAAWRQIAGLKGAAEFGKPSFDAGLPDVEKAQQIADSLLGGTRFSAKVRQSRVNWFEVVLTDAKTGVSDLGEIQHVRADNPRLVLHSQDFSKGSGVGKPFYQIAFSYAHAIGFRVNADPSGLVGANNYRRTEQMMSAAARSGSAPEGLPGIGQRIYGWNARPANQDQQDRNFARIALAAARNAVEVAPEARDLTYDIATNTFSWRKKTKHSLPAEAYVTEALDGPDARTVSVSRSTLARAALTFQAIDGTLRIDPDTEVKSPVLYSIRGDHATDSIYARVESRQPINYKAIAGRKVTYQVIVAETGNVATVELDAAAATQDIDDRIDTLMKLRDCLLKGRG